MSKLKVVHVPEVCEYNEFVERTCEIQEKVGIEVIRLLTILNLTR